MDLHRHAEPVDLGHKAHTVALLSEASAPESDMNDAAPKAVFLKDYTPPAYLVDEVHLTFRLDPSRTRVVSRIAFRPNPDATSTEFTLHGVKLSLVHAAIDGVEVAVEQTEDGITCPAPSAPFIWTAEVEIDPSSNTELEGLYMSNGMYCTQCEAEGFRKVTYYPDRPDVMAPFTVRIEGDAPVMLSNGNPVASGEGWAEWHDPWPKPAYLFALVAGDPVRTFEDHFSDRFRPSRDAQRLRPSTCEEKDLDKCDLRAWTP